MRSVSRLLMATVLGAVLLLSGCSLNLKGQTRFSVGDVEYGLAGVGMSTVSIQISLERVGGTVSEAHVEAISEVDGIVVTNGAGAALPPRQIRLDADAAEGGGLVLEFAADLNSGPWTLEWPGHEPVQLGP